MEYAWSSESHKDADPALPKVSRAVERYISACLENSILADLSIKVRYIPIVMPEALRPRYPARSKLRKKQLLFDCAPQLDYDTFVTGTFEQQIDEYIRGLMESVPFLAKLGATPAQTEAYSAILAMAKESIISAGLDQTRH